MNPRLNVILSLLVLTLTACGNETGQQQSTDSTVLATNRMDSHTHAEGTTFTCPMHPQIVRDAPGSCPICGMDLVAVAQTNAGIATLTLSDEQRQLANVTVQPISSGSVGQTTVLNARLAADQEKIEAISSRVAGRIERLMVKETGQTVRKGQVLYEIYSEPLLTNQQEYLIALEQQRAFPAEEKYRQFRLAAEQKLALYGMTPAQIRQLATAKKVLPRIPFVAPAGGTVTEIAVSEGQYVAEGSLLYRLANLSQLWVEAELYAGESSYVKVGDRVPVEVIGSAAGQNLTARVAFINPEYRNGTQVLLMRAVLPNPGGRFQPGQQARVLLRHGTQRGLTLPTDAVVRSGEGAVVFVQTGTNMFEPRRVQTGTETDQRVAITAGLTGSESVVMSGAYLLYSEMVLKKGYNPFTRQVDTEGVKSTPVIESNPVPVARARAQKPAPQTALAATPSKAVPKAFRQQLTGVYEASLKLTESLIASEAGQAKTAAGGVANALSNVDMKQLAGPAHVNWMTQFNIMNAALKTIRTTGDIGQQRVAFAQFEDGLYRSVKAFGLTDKPVYHQFCPMAKNGAGAYWLSDKKPIRNPYFGEQMLTCGETKDVIQ